MADLTVACVLRTGEDFGPEWVAALRAMVAEHAPLDVVCLTDHPDVPEPTIALRHAWPGWWSKVELYRPGLFGGRVLYLDLDTLVLGDVRAFADYDGRCAFLADLLQPTKRIGGGVILFDGDDPPPFYELFRADPRAAMKRHSHRSDRWYQSVLDVDRIQDRYPGAVASFKKHCRQAQPDGPVLVCGHGQPRFSDPDAGWAYHYWRARAAEWRAAA